MAGAWQTDVRTFHSWGQGLSLEGVGNAVTVHAERAGDGWTCSVAVEAGGRRSEYVVTVSRADMERWGEGGEQREVEELVERSFDFLLEREPPSAILKRFELSVIPRYFPEYDRIFTK